MALTTFVAGNVLTALQLNDSFAAVNVIKAADSATVATSQTTTSTSYTDLATAGPSVTLTTGTSAIVWIHCSTLNNSGVQNNIAVAVSGATTVAAADGNSIKFTGATGTLQAAQAFAIKLTGLTAGSNTFTLKYKVSAGTGTFENRTITVQAL